MSSGIIRMSIAAGTLIGRYLKAQNRGAAMRRAFQRSPKALHVRFC